MSVRMGPASDDLGPPSHRRICIALWVEFNTGDVASVCGATDECVSIGEGIWISGGD